MDQTIKEEIKIVAIPMHGMPLIVRDSYEDVVRTYFTNKVVHCVSLNEKDFMIVSPQYFNDHSQVNLFATTVYRSFNPSETSFHDLVYGPVLMVGKPDKEFDSEFTSLSQESIESIIHTFTRDLHASKYVP